jgi:hypothetical protein
MVTVVSWCCSEVDARLAGERSRKWRLASYSAPAHEQRKTPAAAVEDSSREAVGDLLGGTQQ